jgi:hypothetical protein
MKNMLADRMIADGLLKEFESERIRYNRWLDDLSYSSFLWLFMKSSCSF